MEVLNNVWTALTTPNEGLINVSSIPIICFIELPLIMYMFIYFLNISANKYKKFMYIFLMTIVSILSNFFIPEPINVIFNYCLALFIIKLIFKLNFLKSFIAMIVPAVTFALVNVLLMNPFISLSNITYDQIITVPIYRYLYLLCTYSLFALIVIFLKYKKFALIILEEFDIKTKSILFINLIFGFISIILQLFLTVYYINALPVLITVISSISLLSYFGISIYSLTRVTKLVIKTQELENAEAYNRSLSILHDNVRGFKHDFDNIVATIGGYVKTNDMEGLKKYYYQLEDDCQRVNNVAALNPNLINNPGIFYLLSSKYHEADSKNIKINLEIFLDLNSLNMKIYEFSRILGILLDRKM